MSTPHGDYDIHLDEKFATLELIDIAAEAAAHEPWFNQTLTKVRPPRPSGSPCAPARACSVVSTGDD